jgi:SAM-dependent MidA family methyltransferase
MHSAMIPVDLPPLTPDEAEHEVRVRSIVDAAIRSAGGFLPFDAYQELVLYGPGIGYYAAGAHKLGAGGDFMTAPELSPVFAQCLASECAGVLRNLGGGDILELGAGTGALAADVLSALAREGRLPERYRILEVSPDLRARQRARLAAMDPSVADRVEWLDRLPDGSFRGILLANEVLDALPVARFRVAAEGVAELGITSEAGRWNVVSRPAPARLTEAVRALGIDFALGYESEICLGLAPWLESVTAPLSAGIALFIDYGYNRREYYAAHRSRGTLACFHRHRIHDDVLVRPGLQDITAWVDWTRVAESALEAGLNLAGYTTQSLYLLGAGFDRRIASLQEASSDDEAALKVRAAMRLVMPTDMGERFKCMVLSRNYEVALAGFSVRDLTATL